MIVPDMLAATGQYLQQVKDLNDSDVDVSQQLIDSVETAATESREDLACRDPKDERTVIQAPTNP